MVIRSFERRGLHPAPVLVLEDRDVLCPEPDMALVRVAEGRDALDRRLLEEIADRDGVRWVLDLRQDRRRRIGEAEALEAEVVHLLLLPRLVGGHEIIDALALLGVG